MTAKSSQNKRVVGILKIAFWVGGMLLLATTFSFMADKFYALVSALDVRSLLVLSGVLMFLIGVLVAVLSSKKVSKDSFSLASIVYVTLAFVPTWLGVWLVIKSI